MGSDFTGRGRRRGARAGSGRARAPRRARSARGVRPAKSPGGRAALLRWPERRGDCRGARDRTDHRVAGMGEGQSLAVQRAAPRRKLVNPERWRRIDALLSAALERPDDERTSFLARACEGDEKLRAEVQRLLAAHQAATGFLEPPPDASAALRVTATWTDPERRNRNSSVSEPSSPASVPVAPGSVLGRYIVLSRLGGGGMGVVYGTYDPQLERKVALKLLRTEGAALAGRDA